MRELLERLRLTASATDQQLIDDLLTAPRVGDVQLCEWVTSHVWG